MPVQRKPSDLPSIDRLREVLSYNPETGVFTRRITVGIRARAGDVAGGVGRDGYLKICVDRCVMLGHRIAWAMTHGEWPSRFLDHKNGNPSDNRISNLRQATVVENGHNRRLGRNNTSGFMGVSWNRRARKWQSHITANGKNRNLGLFPTKELAHAAYIEAKRVHHAF